MYLPLAGHEGRGKTRVKLNIAGEGVADTVE
jgi:hypothetical protein